jgi:hypothetical protein
MPNYPLSYANNNFNKRAMMALRSSPVYRPPERGQFKPQGFYWNKLGRHPLEDVS